MVGIRIVNIFIKKTYSLLCVFAAVWLSVAGCASPRGGSLEGTAFDPLKPAKYVLQPGDALRILYPSDSSLEVETTIRADGRIALPYIGEVEAARLAPSELTADLNARYASILKRPDVVVLVEKETGRRVYLGGELKNQGSLALYPNETLLQAVFDAGGFTPEAKPGGVLVMRAVPGEGVHILRADVSRILAGVDRDVILHPMDIVYVPRSTIAKVGQFVDQYVNNLIPRPFQFLFTYELHVQPLRISDNQTSFPVNLSRRR